MTEYQLVWDDTRTGRLRPNHDRSPTLAWLRLTWATGDAFGQGLERVDIYSHHPEVTGRVWVAAAVSIAASVTYCHTHLEQLQDRVTNPDLPAELGDSPWEHRRIVTVTTDTPDEGREKG